MGKKHIIAQKLKWAKISPEKRTEIMSLRGKQRWLKMTDEERTSFAKMLNNARWKRNSVII